MGVYTLNLVGVFPSNKLSFHYFLKTTDKKMDSINRYNISLLVLFVIYIVVHVMTLTRSPLPWFDETFYASIADSLVSIGEFKLAVAPLIADGPIYSYGPFYFLVTGFFIHFFSLDILPFRLVGLLFGFGILIVSYLILRHNKTAPAITVLTCILLALDPTFHTSIHSGHMNSMALFFMLISFLFLLKSRPIVEEKSHYWIILSAICAGIGVLTVPRPGYLLIPMVLILIFWWYQTKNNRYLKQLAIWTVFFSVLLFSWIYYAFGGFEPMVLHYVKLTSNYVGGNFHLIIYQYPLLLFLIILTVLGIIKHHHKIFNELSFFTLISIVLYFLIVKGSSYSILMVPLAYMAIAHLITVLLEGQKIRYWCYSVIGVLLLLNSALFMAKLTLLVGQWQIRDPSLVQDFVSQYIPPNAKVIGDDKYFYAVKKVGADFQYWLRSGSISEQQRIDYHKNDYDFDYLIADVEKHDLTFKAYSSQVTLVEIGKLENPTPNWLSRRLLKIVRLFFKSGITLGYQGSIFKVIK